MAVRKSIESPWLFEHQVQEDLVILSEHHPDRQRFTPAEKFPSLHRPLRESVRIEILGEPRAGKGEVLLAIKKAPELHNDLIETTIIPEFAAAEDFGLGLHESKTRVFPVDTMAWNQLKLDTYWTGMRFIEEVISSDPNPNRVHLVIFERGPFDVLATTEAGRKAGLHWISRWVEKNLDPTRPIFDYLPSVEEMFLIACEAMSLAQGIDSAISYTISLREARNRRRQQGMDSQGKVVNELVWPDFSYGYRWVNQLVLPALNYFYGNGFLRINGNEDLETNNKRVVKYLERVALRTRKRMGLD